MQKKTYPKYRVSRGRRVMVCKESGCDDDNACQGGCSWTKPHVCSACLPIEELLTPKPEKKRGRR